MQGQPGVIVKVHTYTDDAIFPCALSLSLSLSLTQMPLSKFPCDHAYTDAYYVTCSSDMFL
jgi:hypothetical protein